MKYVLYLTMFLSLAAFAQDDASNPEQPCQYPGDYYEADDGQWYPCSPEEGSYQPEYSQPDYTEESEPTQSFERPLYEQEIEEPMDEIREMETIDEVEDIEEIDDTEETDEVEEIEEPGDYID